MLPSGLQGMVMNQVKKMQQQMVRIQEDLDKERVEGSSGGGMVTTTFSGMGDLLEVKISPDVIDPEDCEMLQDLVVTAVRDGMKKAQELHAEKMGEVTGGLQIPGMFGY